MPTSKRAAKPKGWRKAEIIDAAADCFMERGYHATTVDDVAQRMMDIALESHRILGCKGTSRSDFRWDEERGLDGLFLLEVNTQPGRTPLSLVPEQAKQMGISYGELVEKIIAEALGA